MFCLNESLGEPIDLPPIAPTEGGNSTPTYIAVWSDEEYEEKLAALREIINS